MTAVPPPPEAAGVSFVGFCDRDDCVARSRWGERIPAQSRRFWLPRRHFSLERASWGCRL